MKSLTLSSIILSFLFLPCPVASFDDNAHFALTQRAISISTLDSYLKTVLPFELPLGIDDSVEGRRVERHIQDGALLEDSLALFRVRHHFHNPKLSWDQAGLRPPGAQQVGQSSVVWSQNENQGDGGKRSWHQARESYFKALTGTSQPERKKSYADTFRLIGHAMHHVQDAAAPSHTRNDSHLSKWGIGNPDPFHSFAERQEIVALINNPSLLPAVSLDASFLSNQASSNSQYPVPISRLFDVNAGDIGALALGNGSGIGIAEYSNANFFSDDTIFPENFPYPGLANLQISVPELDPQTGKKKTYLFFKPGYGEMDYRLAQASSLRNITGTIVPTDIGLDYKVLTGYAHKLFPRAIGYSAGLIDYFFRGRLTGDFDFESQIPFDQRPNSIGFFNLSISDTTGSEQVGPGTARIVLIKDGVSWGGPINPVPVTETFPDIIVSDPVSINGNPIPSTLSFPFTSTPLPFPTASNLDQCVCSQSAKYVGFLVFKGTLGQETNNAVVVGANCGGGGYNWLFYFVHSHAEPEGHLAAILGAC